MSHNKKGVTDCRATPFHTSLSELLDDPRFTGIQQLLHISDATFFPGERYLVFYFSFVDRPVDGEENPHRAGEMRLVGHVCKDERKGCILLVVNEQVVY